ncbi:hypothetical protein LSH36_2516g00005 [Paralvinella palmiformis]|uniref:Uncharacterized protein n=1 Tax=Paralvinella palmiformis TaxID=53620 RepID=A0AAD9MP79_9ANNE|nr:hypothetical protein LSH36_2516g00005 [Paralvinella palmiformis]
MSFMGCSTLVLVRLIRVLMVFSSPYYLFKDTSASRVLLWPHLKSFVEACETKLKAKPTSNSYNALRDAMNDKLSVAKLSFFNQKASTAYDLLKLDLEKERVENKKIEVGFKAEGELKSLLSTKAISECQVFQFREECRQFVVECVNKIFERSPLKYRLARNMACLDPRLMVSDQEHSKSKCKRLLEELVTLNRVDGDDVDILVASYKELLHDVDGCELKSRFKDFKVEDDRVDMLLYECMGRNKKFEKLWRVVRKVLLVSHGQASVERGYSLNRQTEKDNMSEGVIVALRQIIDYFVLVGGMLKVDITKELLYSASSSTYRYHQYLEEDKRKKGQEAIQRKRKTVQDEVDDLKKRKKVLESDITNLTTSSENMQMKQRQKGKKLVTVFW